MTEGINWAKIMEENKEKIMEKIIECNTEEALGGLQGWHYDIEMDPQGDVWIAGPFSNGQSMSSWKGETYVICSIRTWELEIDHAHWIDTAGDEEMKAKYEKKRDEEGYDAFSFLDEFYPEKIKEWEKEEVEWLREDVYREAEMLFDQAVENEKLMQR